MTLWHVHAFRIIRLNKLLNKQSTARWFDTSCRSYNTTVIVDYTKLFQWPSCANIKYNMNKSNAILRVKLYAVESLPQWFLNKLHILSCDWNISPSYGRCAFKALYYLCWWNCICDMTSPCIWVHDDVIKWKHFPRNWPFVRGIHRWIPHTKASDAELWCLLWSASE